MKKFIVRYRAFVFMFFLMTLLIFFNYSLGLKVLKITGYSLKEMLLVMPPIFILLGLLDIWIPKETMVKHLGEGSGLKGILLSFLLGSAASGPLYGAFPVAAVLMKKGAKFSNILVFIGAWSTTKIPMFLFEVASLGSAFAVTRLLADIVVIIIIASTLARCITKEAIKEIYHNAKKYSD